MTDNHDKLIIQAELDPASLSALQAQISNAIAQSITKGIGERTMFLW